MTPARIIGATRELKAPEGWDERHCGRCAALIIRDRYIAGTPIMTSAWTPTPEELALLNAGASVYLTIVGTSHPPVLVTAGPALPAIP